MRAGSTRSRAAAALQAVVTVAALAAMVFVLSSERERLVAALAIGVVPVFLSGILTLANLAIGSLRLKVMLDRFSAGVGYLPALGVVIGGYTLNYLPMKAGTVLQGAVLKTRWNVRVAHFAALSAAGQLVSLWSSVTLAGACLALIGGMPIVSAVLLIVPSASLGALVLWARWSSDTRTVHDNRFVEATRVAVRGLGDLLAHRRVMLVTIAVNLGAVVLVGVRTYVLLEVLATPVSLLDAMVISAFANASHIFGILPGGIGFREGGIVAGAALVGVEPGAALTFALIDRGIDLAVVLVFGVPSALWMARAVSSSGSSENA